jgi:hypothetical protein
LTTKNSIGGVGVLGGAGRTLDDGDAFAAVGSTLGAVGVLGPNRAADAGPQTRAKAAIKEMRANMQKAELGD